MTQFDTKKQIPWQALPEQERNQRVIQLYASGKYTYASLARMFKVSRQRIYAIFKRAKEANEKVTG